ncbi:MAG: four helix bundle protein [Acidimicrobiia bacterium]|nr:four helix bundle protein [Acidimicrobiia bacterium]
MTGVPSQIRWSAGAVPGSIAEGCARKHAKIKENFYYASRGAVAASKRPLLDGERAGYFHDLACKELKALSGDMLKRTMSIYE